LFSTKLKQALITVAILYPFGQGESFELMSDAFGYIVKVVLGQYIDKKSHMIYYANYILNDAQINYTMNKKECYV